MRNYIGSSSASSLGMVWTTGVLFEASLASQKYTSDGDASLLVPTTSTLC